MGGELLRTMPGPASVLELCAGAGHIGLLALGMAGRSPDQHRLVAVDVNPAACEIHATQRRGGRS